ncbi:MAG: MalT-like region [Symbiobacteriaceae bacterium]|nr:MalT-like region [Symbiobacteriaceae bacterium]
MKEHKYTEALQEVERVLKSSDSPEIMLHAHKAKVICLCRLGERQAAVSTGDISLKLAEDLGDWDSFGTLTIYIGVAYSLLGHLDEAMRRMYVFLSHLHQYQNAAKEEKTVWYNLGVFQTSKGDHAEATRSLDKAFTVALSSGNHRYAHGVRQSLIDVSLRAGFLDRIPMLLAQCGKYFRDHQDMESFQVSWAHYVRLRGEYALSTNRTRRARLVATRGLSKLEGSTSDEYVMHELLSRIADHTGSPVEAVGHSLAARTCAIMSGRSDRETDAGDALLRLSRSYPGVAESVDQHYIIML